jgi:hypothetical protein
MLIPESYKVRHLILQTLADKRSEQQLNKRPVEDSQLTIDEIARLTGHDRKLIDQQLNVLWDNKDVIDVVNIQNQGDATKTKYMILPKGISIASSKSILNDGQLINSQLLNNYASALFQFIVCVTAIWTIYQNVTSIESLTKDNNRIQKQLDLLFKYQLETKKQLTIHNYSVDSLKNNQTILRK